MYSKDNNAGPDWYEIAKAIHNYLRHEYANAKFGIEADPPPMRISTYSGKGVGYYATGLDGRADWTPEFYKYLERAEARMVEHGELRFGFREVDAAMHKLEIEHPKWFDVLVDCDVRGVKPEDLAEQQNKGVTTIRRYRRHGIQYLFVELIAVPTKARKVLVKLVQVA